MAEYIQIKQILFQYKEPGDMGVDFGSEVCACDQSLNLYLQ